MGAAPAGGNPVVYRVIASADRTFRTPEGYNEGLFGQQLMSSEDDGTRTRNHRIDRPAVAFSRTCKIRLFSRDFRLPSAAYRTPDSTQFSAFFDGFQVILGHSR